MVALKVHYGRGMRGLCASQSLLSVDYPNRSPKTAMVGWMPACLWDVHARTRACLTSNLHSHENQDQTMCLPKPYACADRPAAGRVTTIARATWAMRRRDA
jgi:hypothetical protein